MDLEREKEKERFSASLFRLFSIRDEKTGSRKRDMWRLRIYLVCCVLVLLTVFDCSYRAFSYDTDIPAPKTEHALVSGELVTQNIAFHNKKIRALHIRFRNNGSMSGGEVCVCFYKNDEPVREWRIQAAELADDVYRIFEFGRPVSMSEKDHCYFTIQYTFNDSGMETGGLAVGISPGDFYTSAPEPGTAEAYEGSAVSYLLTVEDGVMRRRVVFPFLAGVTILCFLAFFLLDIRRFRIRTILLGTVIILLTVE
ncbi:MAG: hypothetical protein Q4D81_00165, partial [Eubacteriales bacterium]|nr:hypothetical protein [Eubacteriales bacterium]